MFNQSTPEVRPDSPIQTGQATQGTLQSMSREVTEARGMVEAAKSFPRNTHDAFTALMHSCNRSNFAELATYKFPRGGRDITGPSVNLAREAARCWGNVTSGVRIIHEDKKSVHLQGFAWDLETNYRVVHEDKFAKLIQRKDKRTGEVLWIEPDERDLRELVNRRGALLLRNALLQVLPRDLVDDACQAARSAVVADSQGKLRENREDTIKAMVMAFDEISVKVSMLERYLGHPLDEIDAEELAGLRSVFKSISDGTTSRSDHFEIGGGTSTGAEDLNARAKDADAPEFRPEPARKPEPEVKREQPRSVQAEPARETVPADPSVAAAERMRWITEAERQGRPVGEWPQVRAEHINGQAVEQEGGAS